MVCSRVTILTKILPCQVLLLYAFHDRVNVVRHIVSSVLNLCASCNLRIQQRQNERVYHSEFRSSIFYLFCQKDTKCTRSHATVNVIANANVNVIVIVNVVTFVKIVALFLNNNK